MISFLLRRATPKFSSAARQHDRDERIWLTADKDDLRLAGHPEVKAVILEREVPEHYLQTRERLLELAETDPLALITAGPLLVSAVGEQDIINFFGHCPNVNVETRTGDNGFYKLHIDGGYNNHGARLLSTIMGETTMYYAGPITSEIREKMEGNGPYAGPKTAFKASTEGVVEHAPEASVMAFKGWSRRHNDPEKLLFHAAPRGKERVAWLAAFVRLGKKPLGLPKMF